MLPCAVLTRSRQQKQLAPAAIQQTIRQVMQMQLFMPRLSFQWALWQPSSCDDFDNLSCIWPSTVFWICLNADPRMSAISDQLLRLLE